MTAQISGKQALTGQVEATAVGNILAQMLRAGVFRSLQEARSLVAKSFNLKENQE